MRRARAAHGRAHRHARGGLLPMGEEENHGEGREEDEGWQDAFHRVYSMVHLRTSLTVRSWEPLVSDSR